MLCKNIRPACCKSRLGLCAGCGYGVSGVDNSLVYRRRVLSHCCCILWNVKRVTRYKVKTITSGNMIALKGSCCIFPIIGYLNVVVV